VYQLKTIDYQANIKDKRLALLFLLLIIKSTSYTSTATYKWIC